jgi:DNA-directed RNA polymerase sigma subunit (sigma70/sigma32)
MGANFEPKAGMAMSLQEIAERLAAEEGGEPISVERVRQIEAKAIEKLRRNARRLRLNMRDLFFERDPPFINPVRRLR